MRQLFVLVVLSLAESARLPSDIIPYHYHLTLAPKKDCTFSGEVEIDVEVRNTTGNITFHAKNLDIDESSIKLIKLDESAVGSSREFNESGTQDVDEASDWTIARNQDLMTLSLSQPLEIESKYRLFMVFNGTMNSKKSSGLYCRRQRANRTRWLVSTAFEPLSARTAFPCWDEPGFKANFTVSVAHENGTYALSNMPLKTSETYDRVDGWVLDTFHTTPKMATYLVSIFLSNTYGRLSTRIKSNKEITVWATPARVNFSDLPLRMAARHMDFLQEYTDFNDPMPKTDFISIKNFFAGGLENWGIISYEESAILFDPKYRRNKQVVMFCCNLIGHELAHSWFGNLVTPSWWDDIWLSEGFASYYAALSTAKVYPAWGFETQSWINARELSMNKDSLPTTHPLVPQIDSEKEVSKDIFDEITYKKGQSILRMLNYTIGEKALKNGVRNYIKKRQFSSASHQQLWESLDEAASQEGTLPENKSLSVLMESWLKNPGYPVVSVIRDYETGKVVLTQRSILNKEFGVRDEEPGGWWIPLSYTYKTENQTVTSPRIWLDPDVVNTTIDDPAPSDNWLLFNLHGAGYFRVRYDDVNTNYLFGDLRDVWLDDRISVLADMLELARLGFSTVSNYFKGISWLRNETSPYPWMALLGSAYKQYYLLRGTEIETYFTEFLNELLTPEMERIREDSPHRKTLVELSCKVGVDKCEKLVREYFKNWAADSNNKVPEDIRPTVYCTGVAEGDSKTWMLVNSRYTLSDDAKERKDLLKALACTKNKNTLQKYLTWALEPSKGSLGQKKTSVMMKAVAKQDPDMVLAALSTKQFTPSKKKNAKWQKLLENLALEINSETQLEQLRGIVSSNFDLYKSDLRSSPIVQIAEDNVMWVRENSEEMKRFIMHSRKPTPK